VSLIIVLRHLEHYVIGWQYKIVIFLKDVMTVQQRQRCQPVPGATRVCKIMRTNL